MAKVHIWMFFFYEAQMEALKNATVMLEWKNRYFFFIVEQAMEIEKRNILKEERKKTPLN